MQNFYITPNIYQDKLIPSSFGGINRIRWTLCLRGRKLYLRYLNWKPATFWAVVYIGFRCNYFGKNSIFSFLGRCSWEIVGPHQLLEREFEYSHDLSRSYRLTILYSHCSYQLHLKTASFCSILIEYTEPSGC